MRRYAHIYSLLLILVFAACGVSKVQQEDLKENFIGSYYIIDSAWVKDREMNTMLLEYRNGVDSLMEKIIGKTDIPLTKAQPECTLGYLTVESMYDAIKAKDPSIHAAVSNYGGIRINYLSPGAISMGSIFELMPFDNTLMVVEVPGTIMIEWMDHIAAWGGWPVKNIHFQIKDKKALNVSINQQAVNPNIVYKIVTSDYIAYGGDNCSFLKSCKKYKYNILMRDAIIDYISVRNSRNESIHFTLENRLEYAE